MRIAKTNTGLSLIWAAVQIAFLFAGRSPAQSLDWYKPSLPSIPSPRFGAGLAYDVATGSTVLFGGKSGNTIYGDTWILGKKGWVQGAPAVSPPALCGESMAWDAATGTIVLFGGGTTAGDIAETWIWDGATWKQMNPLVSPPARDTAGMAYDPSTGRVLLFGGENIDGSVLNDTWEWDGKTKTWTQEFPASSPSPRRTKLVYDAAAQAIILYGGDNAAGDCCDTYFNDTWKWNGVTWTQLVPDSSPPARALPALAYDAAIGEIIMFGGYSVPGEGLNDTWTWNGTTWSQRQTTHSPPGSWAAGMDYDPSLKSVVLFGGMLTGDSTANDTWLAVP